MREVLPLITLIEEIHEAFGIEQTNKNCNTKYTVFEDNNGCIELAKCPKLRPRTKHIGIKYHHFRSKVMDGTIKVLPIDTKDQEAHIFTKPLSRDQFHKLCELLMGW